MNRIQRSLLLILAAVLLAVSVQLGPARTAQAAYTCGATTRWNVVLERDMRDVGDVYTWNTSDNVLHTRSVVLYGWRIQESWMEAKTYFGALPRNSDGTFNYALFSNHRTHANVTEYTFSLPFKSSWLTGTEMHMAWRMSMVKLDSYGQIIDRAVAWGYQKAVGPALYYKHTIHTCKDLSQYDGCQNYWWRTDDHLDSWVNHSPNDSFNQTFGRTAFSPDITLRQALYLEGNGIQRAARHTAAALLNADHPNINYAYTVSEVMSLWYRSFDTKNYAAAANTFYEANSTGCPLQ